MILPRRESCKMTYQTAFWISACVNMLLVTLAIGGVLFLAELTVKCERSLRNSRYTLTTLEGKVERLSFWLEDLRSSETNVHNKMEALDRRFEAVEGRLTFLTIQSDHA